MAGVEVTPGGDADAGIGSVAGRLAQQVIASSVEEMEPRWAQWEGTSSTTADDEIANYRALISQAAAQLRAANVQVGGF